MCYASSRNSHNFVYDSKKVYNHKLVVIISDKPDEIIETNKTGLSERILKIGCNEAQNHTALNLLRSLNIEKFKKDIWKFYIRRAGYVFYKDYIGFNVNFKDDLKNNLSSFEANYFNHGTNYEKSSIKFKEIIYSAVEAFMPADGDVIKFIQSVESIHNRIVIIDERIQEYAGYGRYTPKNKDGTPAKDIRVSKIYENTNIYVPAKSPDDFVCNLGAQNFDEQYLEILAIFKDQMELAQAEKNPCFYVIHLGIIEKLIASHNKQRDVKTTYNKDSDIKKFLEDIICVPNKIDYNRIVIISGRGIPHNLPANTRYLSYSIISQYMIDLRFKFLLSEAVFSSRKVKTN